MMENPNVNEVVAGSIHCKLDSLRVLSPQRCIYRIPEICRRIKEADYQPGLVSIGPFHRGVARLKSMEEQKLRYLKSFLDRGRNDNIHYLEECIKLIGDRETDIRECYAEEIRLSSKDFVEMVLIDAAFIIELLLRLFTYVIREEDCVLFNKPSMISVVLFDLLVEENQLPFFILRMLFKPVSHPQTSDSPICFVRISCEFIINMMTSHHETIHCDITTILTKVQAAQDIKHFVDLFRIFFLPSTLRENNIENQNTYCFTKNARQLSAAGVKFVPIKTGQLLDITFDKGVLKIPTFQVNGYTELIFRNLVAFEQCHYRSTNNSYVIDYMCFLDHLIDSPMDVEILVRNGVIDNMLATCEEVANIFNTIPKQTTISSYYYKDVSRKVNAYASISYNRWMATLKSNYFNHPWAIISVIYAVVLLILTLLQTISSFTVKN